MSDLRAARRTYSLSELPLWMERSSADWERAFDADALEYGRALYTSGKVRSLDLSNTEAVVNVRLEDSEEPYCIIEYAQNGGFSCRGSSEDSTLTSAIAVAGFYEIEELVADETWDRATLDVFQKKPAAAEPPANGAFFKTQPAMQSFEKPAQGGATTKPAQGGAAESQTAQRKLVLKFSSKRGGLYFGALWKGADAVKKVFGENSLDSSKLTYAERENLVRLVTFARRSGFKYDKDSFMLEELSKIPAFVSKTLPQWAEYFTVEKGKDVDVLALGERQIEVSSIASEIEGSDSMFEVAWTTKVGGHKLTDEELSKIIGRGGGARILPSCGIVRISDQDESFIRQIERAREFANGRVPRYMLLTLFNSADKVNLTGRLSKWRAAIEDLPSALKNADADDLPDFLRKYQRMGVAWFDKVFAVGCNALLADEMGLGKTVQSLCAISRRWDGARAFLIVCPASVIPVWIAETKRFFPQMVCEALSSENAERIGGGAKIWVASYTQLRRNREFLEKADFDIAILDEAQSIKNPESKTTMACMCIRAPRKIALTGTPLENRLLDLWTIFRWLMPGLMGSRAAFEHFVSAGDSALQVVKRQISPFILRRVKSEVAKELPEKIYVDLACPLTQMQRAEYDKLLERARTMLKENMQSPHAENARQGRISILSLITRLRQVSCDAALLPWVECEDHLSSGKMSVLLDKLEELYLNGKKILIFSQFTSLLDRIKRFTLARCPDISIYELTGKTRDRALPVMNFQGKSGAGVILVSLRAGGTGITLTSADYVFFMDPWWNPAVEEQAVDRVHRIGRNREVFIYRMIAESTVEERVRALQSEKKRLFDDIFSGLSDVSAADKFFETVSKLIQ